MIDSPNTESISIHGQVSSVSNGQNLCSTSFNKNSNLNTETISFIPINQNQQSSSLIKKAKDDATPLFSESTEEDAMTEIVKNFMADLPIDSSQASDLHSANIWLDEIETKTMREIPVDKLLSLKKSLMPVERNRLQTTENVLSDHSNISLTGDEEAQSSSDETDESEETRSER
uniref:Bm12979, isoform a n=1 Tax=Brugia malayi TaxID=6279 RepID=A0A1I9G6K9_BRUMA|nr:Bm12979, isoform a [Brugia malayi]